jgi:hypothetical protein
MELELTNFEYFCYSETERGQNQPKGSNLLATTTKTVKTEIISESSSKSLRQRSPTCLLFVTIIKGGINLLNKIFNHCL